MANPQNPYPPSKLGALWDFVPSGTGLLIISSGLRPAEPSVPVIHPTSKLVGILANEIKNGQRGVFDGLDKND